MRAYLCGVPRESCQGGLKQVNAFLRAMVFRVHSSPESAFACHKRYLVSRGFVPVGNRELLNPETGAIRVMTKKSRFGGRLRRGKSGEKGTARVMAYKGNTSAGGTIIHL